MLSLSSRSYLVSCLSLGLLNHFVFIFVCHVRECSHFTAYTPASMNPAGAQALTQEPTPPGEPCRPAAAPSASMSVLLAQRLQLRLPHSLTSRGAQPAQGPQASWAPGGVLIWPSVAGDQDPRAHRAVSGLARRQKHHFRPRLVCLSQRRKAAEPPPDKHGPAPRGPKGCAAGTC